MIFRRRPKDGSSPNLAERERVYGLLWREAAGVYHERAKLAPHVDVYRYGPADERPFHTLVTAGMSDLPMPGAPADRRRAELVLYVDEPSTQAAEMLRRLAHFPHMAKRWLDWGHTADYGDPDPNFPTLDALLFWPPPVSPDESLQDELKIAGDAVRLLWVVPVSSAELQVVRERGSEALADIFGAHNASITFDPARRSYA